MRRAHQRGDRREAVHLGQDRRPSRVGGAGQAGRAEPGRVREPGRQARIGHNGQLTRAELPPGPAAGASRGCPPRYLARPLPCHDEAMRVQRFGARAAAGPRGGAIIAIPFDPDRAWGAMAEHRVGGTINGRQVRGTIAPAGGGWTFTVTPMWMRDAGVAAGDDVLVELAPEGPLRGDLADDISAALEASPAAAAFFDTLAQFYRKAYLRWIDATTRRPDLRAARIAEVVGLLAAGIKQRPRP